MKLILNAIEELSSSIIEWYGNYVKKIVVGGKSFSDKRENEEVIYLLVLDKVSKISIFSRGEIFLFFYNKLLKSKTIDQFKSKYGSLPKILGIVLSPKELEYEIPLVDYVMKNGYVLFDREVEENG
ncbi:hypothetical protein BFU36_10735 [Sulfolobus sp. A20]|uniref:hypothetical protein n=1 Tax=Sulfolobaceae TaxID=118883 RepID=UPI000845EA3D|nr:MULTISPECIES: hypothetical protein [unclassified Sulfolobus]TRM73029.1 hypothetical protein DJ523_08350 [Sulfolobus sp. E5]TRM77651.1 hypothetical protein DJ528_06250 [Sulfolobus sp. B5]TRM78417.1 hypothetical protein DJ532_01285 [Sulfolobus sp. A20-N-F8]TRM80747.1 hypothetical protein DJ531_11890 [Sulfolobus sp. A20-N-F6]TRM82125.1 hypothetical protein DJ524_01770 [Sulfolobus sp. D5]TRM87610.1 hypothetical protein DJ521_03320 [Sulfolobus sp. E3]TRM89173.1 hypothetical protein DJ529_02920